MKTNSNNITNILFMVILPISILLIWYYLTSTQKVHAMLLPSIDLVLHSFWKQLSSGELIKDILISLFRVISAFFIATISAIIIGISMALSLKTNYFFSFIFDAIRQIPPLAWIPLLILWFGIGEISKIILIFSSAFFPVLINTINGIRNTPQGYIDLGNLHRLNFWKMLKKIYIPFAIPSIFTGLNLGLGASWSTVVAAELIAANSGIGYRINDARILMQAEVIIVGIISIGIIGVLMTFALAKLENYLLPWKMIK